MDDLRSTGETYEETCQRLAGSRWADVKDWYDRVREGAQKADVGHPLAEQIFWRHALGINAQGRGTPLDAAIERWLRNEKRLEETIGKATAEAMGGIATADCAGDVLFLEDLNKHRSDFEAHHKKTNPGVDVSQVPTGYMCVRHPNGSSRVAFDHLRGVIVAVCDGCDEVIAQFAPASSKEAATMAWALIEAVEAFAEECRGDVTPAKLGAFQRHIGKLGDMCRGWRVARGAS